MSVIDYRKWDNFQDSSDEEDEHEPCFECEKPCCMYPGLGDQMYNEFVQQYGHEPNHPEFQSKKKSFEGWFLNKLKSKYVRIHPEDDCVGLAEIFFTHPDSFVPSINHEDGVSFENWGLFKTVDDSSCKALDRAMRTQYLYRGNEYKDIPEVQFVKRLIVDKVVQLEKRKQTFDISQNLKRDYVMKISLMNVKPRVWRRFKVSGGVTLNAFEDKVISPIMGWVRNYHAHCFHTTADGAVYGCTDSDAVDMCWVNHNGYAWINGSLWNLGIILLKVGDRMLYKYDLGDKWEHEIVVEEIRSLEASDGKCELIGGEMNCPPEDSIGLDDKGNTAFQKFIDSLPSKKQWKGPSARNVCRNVKTSLRKAGQAMNIKSAWYDPYHFNLEERQTALKLALGSPASTRTGSKRFILAPSSGEPFPRRMQPHEKVIREYINSNPLNYLEETVRIDRDSKKDAICNNCGNPNNLHLCANCCMVRYCSRQCQKEQWKVKHKSDCSSLKIQHDTLRSGRAKQKKKHATSKTHK